MKNDPVAKVYKICKSVSKLTDEDFKAMDLIAQQQLEYIHPLKNKTQAMYNELGNHNQRVIAALRMLKILIPNPPKQ